MEEPSNAVLGSNVGAVDQNLGAFSNRVNPFRSLFERARLAPNKDDACCAGSGPGSRNVLFSILIMLLLTSGLQYSKVGLCDKTIFLEPVIGRT